MAITDIDSLISARLAELPGLQHNYRTDPLYHYHIQWLRRVLTTIENSLRVGSIPDHARTDLLRDIVSETIKDNEVLETIKHLQQASLPIPRGGGL